MAPRYVIGVDGGTESIRAGVFDAAGVPLSFASAPYPTSFPRPSWAEQDPEDWWAGLGAAVRAALAQARVLPAAVAGLAVDTTCCTVVALDGGGAPLRPALLWMDMRSAPQAARLVAAAAGDAALAVNAGGAGPVSAEWMVPKALWLKENEPRVYAAAATICEYQDFINLRLTGRLAASRVNAAARWHFGSAPGGGPPASLLAAVGAPELAAKWPADVLPLGARVGGLTAAAAAHVGLPEGLLVAQGGADAFVGMIGLGVVQPGRMALLTGSSHLHLGVVGGGGPPVHGPGVWGTYADALAPGLGVVEGGQTSTGSAAAWLRRLLAGQASGGGGEPAPAGGAAAAAPALSYAALDAEAAAAPAGAGGVAALDHFQGNRTPHTDPASRGALVGLTLAASRGAVWRALLESVCFGTAAVLEAMAAAGFSVSEIAVAGGAARSPFWLQLHADVTGLPFATTECGDAPALGCAVLAAVAAGLHPSVDAAVAAMVRRAGVVRPDAAAHAAYAPHYARYKELYAALRPGFHAAAAAAAAEGEGNSGGSGGGGAAAAPAAAAAAPPPPPPRAPSVRGLRPIVSPSILSADFAALGADVARVAAAGAEWVHVDVFDGVFVPNLTIGPPVVKALRRRCPGAFLDCHLCVVHPENYVDDMAAAGASQFTFHIEAAGVDMSCDAAAALAARARAAGMAAGVALAPETPADAVFPLLEAGAVDTVLLLSVRPGFGGQKFMPSVLPKVAALRARYPGVNIEVDGGIGVGNAREVAAAGANALVAGTAVFAGAAPPERAVPELVALVAAGLAECPALAEPAVR